MESILKNKIKICIFSTTFFPNIGGAERFINGLANHLSQLGFDVYVLVPYNLNIAKSKFDYKIIPLRVIKPFTNIPILLELVLLTNLFFAHMKYKFNLIQAVVLYPSGYVAGLFGRIFKVPTVLRPTGEDLQINEGLGYGLRRNNFVRSRVQTALNLCTNVIAISPSIQDDLIALLKTEFKKKIVPISNGLDIDRFMLSPKYNIKLDLHLPASALVLISVGRNHPKKDYRTLIEGFTYAAEELSNIYLVIVGGNEEPLRNLISERMKNRIFLLGSIPKDMSVSEKIFVFPPDQILGYLKTSDIFVFTSLIEGSPNAVLEAIAAGLPIIAVNAPGTKDYVSDNKNGLLIAAKDPKDLSKAILKLAKSSDLRQKFSAENIKLRRLFDWNEIVGRYVKIYKDLVKL